jgi:hypothetical protein
MTSSESIWEAIITLLFVLGLPLIIAVSILIVT